MTSLVLFTAAIFTQSSTPPAFTAKLGTPYMLGPISTVIGTKEKIEIGIQRVVTLRSAETAIAFGGRDETYVAAKGKKLVIFRASIKNPERMPIRIAPSSTFGLRMFDTKFVAGDLSYLGAFTETLAPLAIQLKTNQTANVVTIYQVPESSPHFRMAIFFDRYLRTKDPHFDLTKHFKAPRSIFAVDPLNYRMSASAQVGKWFDLDDLEFNVASCEKTSDGYRARVQVRNPMLKAGRWGWQYAKATLVDASGSVADYYPDFVATPEHANWRNEVPGGKMIEGDYAFRCDSSFKPVKMVLKMASTERQVDVKL